MKKESFESLLSESLSNAKNDRKLALAAFDQMKQIFENIDTEKVDTMQAVLLVGQNAVKLLEQSSRSNEQIIRLAQLKEKEERALEKSDDSDDVVVTMEELKKAQSGS